MKQHKVLEMNLVWQKGLLFEAQQSGHSVNLDTVPPMGSDKGMSPKQLLLASVMGCTAMDVAALLKKYRQPEHTFRMSGSGPLTDGYPAVFSKIDLEYAFEGQLDSTKVIEAVTLSMTKYCGVSAMIVKACPIHYQISLNGEVIKNDQASFDSAIV